MMNEDTRGVSTMKEIVTGHYITYSSDGRKINTEAEQGKLNIAHFL